MIHPVNWARILGVTMQELESSPMDASKTDILSSGINNKPREKSQ